MDQIDTSTLSNQNLSAALLVHTYTNTTRVRKLFIAVDADQIAGNGSYSVYATVQRAGAGNHFRLQPTTTATVASGVTSVSFESIPVVLNATDVLKVYVTGLAGDTTTPDITTRVWEEPSPRTDLGVTTANLDTQLSTLAANSATALLDATNGIETGVTPRQCMRAMAAMLAGLITGGGTGLEVFKGLGQAAAGTTRVTVTVDQSGNRSAITLNL